MSNRRSFGPLIFGVLLLAAGLGLAFWGISTRAKSLDVEARVELFERVHGALRDLEGFSHLWLLTHLHTVDGWTPEVVPFLHTVARGVLATRSPLPCKAPKGVRPKR